MMVIDNKLEIGQELYLKTDPDQYKRMCTAITLRCHGLVYELALGDQSSWHSEVEISKKKDVMISSTN